jgi:hypothetical protein
MIRLFEPDQRMRAACLTRSTGLDADPSSQQMRTLIVMT